jgi:hypothetical protein
VANAGVKGTWVRRTWTCCLVVRSGRCFLQYRLEDRRRHDELMEFDVIFCRVVRGAGVRNERNVVTGPQSTGQNLVPFVNPGVVAGKGDGPGCTFLGNRNRQWGESLLRFALRPHSAESHPEVEILSHDRRVSNCVKSSQPVQLLAIEMGMDVDSRRTTGFLGRSD